MASMTTGLDMATMLVMLALSAALMCLLVPAGAGWGRADGLGGWRHSLLALAAGFLLMLGRKVLPPAAGVAAANALLLAGVLLQARALAEFEGRAVPAWATAAPPVILFGLVLPVASDFPTYTVISAMTLAPALGLVGWRGLKSSVRHATGARWTLAAIYAIAGVTLLGRAMAIGHGDAHVDLFTVDLLDTVAMLAQFGAIVGGSVGFLVFQRARLEERARLAAMHDGLTGLFNRRAFDRLAAREIARASRRAAPFAVLMIDLDHFKAVNDDFGHPAGDRVLVDFAGVLQRCTRAADLVARYGGEEFCALLPETDAATALRVAERIRAAAAEGALGGLPRPVTASLGLTVVPVEAGASLAAALERADRALYAAKAAGRNRAIALPFRDAPPPVRRLAA
jgi:diguanylate cyclase (GGDEF)-like protein